MFKRSLQVMFVAHLMVSCAVVGESQKLSGNGPAPSSATATTIQASTTQTNPRKLLSDREKETIDEINFAREKPAEFLKLLQEFRKNFRGNEIHFPDGRILVTNEGVAALEDAIAFVQTLKPLAPYELREGLIHAARVHVNDLVITNRSGHLGSDGSKPGDRFSRFGNWQGSVGENIIYDSRNPRSDIILMAIDDGTANRGHRRNLFKSEFHVIGIALGQRPKAEMIGVITLAGGYE